MPVPQDAEGLEGHVTALRREVLGDEAEDRRRRWQARSQERCIEVVRRRVHAGGRPSGAQQHLPEVLAQRDEARRAAGPCPEEGGVPQGARHAIEGLRGRDPPRPPVPGVAVQAAEGPPGTHDDRGVRPEEPGTEHVDVHQVERRGIDAEHADRFPVGKTGPADEALGLPPAGDRELEGPLRGRRPPHRVPRAHVDQRPGLDRRDVRGVPHPGRWGRQELLGVGDVTRGGVGAAHRRDE